MLITCWCHNDMLTICCTMVTTTCWQHVAYLLETCCLLCGTYRNLLMICLQFAVDTLTSCSWFVDNLWRLIVNLLVTWTQLIGDTNATYWWHEPWPPLVTGLISDILGSGAVGETYHRRLWENDKFSIISRKISNFKIFPWELKLKYVKFAFQCQKKIGSCESYYLFFESLKVQCTMLSTHSTHLRRLFRLTIGPRLEYDGTNR